MGMRRIVGDLQGGDARCFRDRPSDESKLAQDPTPQPNVQAG